MGYVAFGLLMGFIVSWIHMASLLREGRYDNLPRAFFQNPFHPIAVPFAILYQLVTGGLPKLRVMFLWTVVIWSSVAMLVVRIVRKLFA